MPQSLAQVSIHFVFSTKNRAPFLLDKAFRREMHAYLGTTCGYLDSPSEIVGGVADHVHLLCRLSRTHTLADTVRELKRESSKWAKTKGAGYADFHWQDGYGAFSISPAHRTVLIDYIENQEQHHAELTFQDEYRRLLAKYNVEYDERYVWD